MLTREWPPDIYGGAGVHVTNLVAALNNQPNVEVVVHYFGSTDKSESNQHSYVIPEDLASLDPASQALAIDLRMAQNLGDVDVIHSHTWYSNMAGHWGSYLHRAPHVVTAHSLEPLRPWKEEQLGSGYRISRWAERTAYLGAQAVISVSDGMRDDILATYPELDPRHVFTIRNGVDTQVFAPRVNETLLDRLGIAGPYALFVGRITRQKGLAHLLRAWRQVPPEITLVLAASHPDEPGIGAEVNALVAELQQERTNIIWIQEMLPREDLISLLTSARVALVPSVYEPLGIVNLEAMACGTAVVASDVGGIPEVVAHGITGELVRYESDHEAFERALAQTITRVVTDEELCERYGLAGRRRAVDEFSWEAVAEATVRVYERLLR
jgi:alpha-maltose-1-phosphate synthase